MINVFRIIHDVGRIDNINGLIQKKEKHSGAQHFMSYYIYRGSQNLAHVFAASLLFFLSTH